MDAAKHPTIHKAAKNIQLEIWIGAQFGKPCSYPLVVSTNTQSSKQQYPSFFKIAKRAWYNQEEGL